MPANRQMKALQRLSSPLRIPPVDQRAAKTIKRLWMADDAGALALLGQRIALYMSLFIKGDRHGDAGSRAYLTLAQWYLNTAPPGMHDLSYDGKSLKKWVSPVGRVAGEVRFIKDRGGDHQEWGWNPPNASERDIDPNYKFDAKNLKPVAATLRSALMALGHIQTARSTFTKIRSQRISPDGNIGGKGYVMPIKDIRKQLANCDEALSAITDTLYDEMQAIHWHPQVDDSGGDPRERGLVKKIMDDVEDIRDDPEEWAGGEEGESKLKKASAVDRLTLRWVTRRSS